MKSTTVALRQRLLRRVIEDLAEELGRSPCMADLAEAMGFPRKGTYIYSYMGTTGPAVVIDDAWIAAGYRRPGWRTSHVGRGGYP